MRYGRLAGWKKRLQPRCGYPMRPTASDAHAGQYVTQPPLLRRLSLLPTPAGPYSSRAGEPGRRTHPAYCKPPSAPSPGGAAWKPYQPAVLYLATAPAAEPAPPESCARSRSALGPGLVSGPAHHGGHGDGAADARGPGQQQRQPRPALPRGRPPPRRGRPGAPLCRSAGLLTRAVLRKVRRSAYRLSGYALHVAQQRVLQPLKV